MALTWKTGPIKGTPNGSVLTCIVTPCEAWLDVTPSTVDVEKAAGISQAMGAPAGFLSQQAIMQHAQKVERACEQHLSKHTVQEWAPALAKAQQRVRELEDELEREKGRVR